MLILEDAIVPGTSRRIASIDECQPELQELYRLWERLRGDRMMPARGDFDPLQVPRLLPDIFLVDVFAQNPRDRRFRVRLQGTSLVEYYGADWTGFYIHEMIDPVSAERFCAAGDHIVASREPAMLTGSLYWVPAKPFYHFESVHLPFSNDGTTVNMIIGLTKVF